jgi:hypothetical protein
MCYRVLAKDPDTGKRWIVQTAPTIEEARVIVEDHKRRFAQDDVWFEKLTLSLLRRKLDAKD